MRTLYRASRVWTLSHPPVGEWVLVDGRHVQRVGSGDPPEADRVVELPGTTILPGFVDAHVHLTGTGLHEADPAIAGVRSAGELVAAARDVAAAGEGPTLLHGFDESAWSVPGLPGRTDLDQASPRPLCLVRTDGHLSLANLPALRDSGALGAPGCELDERGEPTGRVRGEANERLLRWFAQALPDHAIQELQLRAAALAASRGVTSVHEMSVPALRGLRDAQVLLEQRSRLPVDVVLYLGTTDIPQAIDLGLPRIGGDLPVDGSIGAGTAALSAPYVDGGGRGETRFEDDELAEFLHDAHLAGLQVGLHAIGDRAIEQVLSTWERIYRTLDSRDKRHFRARRHRVEHFEMPVGQHIERAAVLGLAISVQPTFDARWGQPGGLYERRLGQERARAMNPFRALLDRGLEVGAGSDAPVTSLDPIEALLALERHHDGAQRLSRWEAIRLHTIGSARLAHQEDKKGALEPGMHADFAAYESDPFAEGDPERLRPVLTVSLGREVSAR
ncbi:MAG TPA: amidohydrolase family protein [Actinomycetota bacterium]|nr:amidohydrolase family protein [Actinomycetota bacterium]